jgi:RNA polymerase sigma factor (sigma-70 family)
MRTPEDIHDEWLVLRCQEGNAAALSELVAKWQPRILRHAMRLTANREAAADVTQAVWLAIIRGIDQLHDPACFRRWAYRIVAFKSADWIRNRQQDRAFAGPIVTEPTDYRPTGTAPSNENDIAAIRLAMMRLTPDQKSILSMFYLEDMPLVEIAEAMSLPLGTIKSRLHYARQALKDTVTRSKP